MAKEKRSAADLDAELAALEAELAALEGKGKKRKPSKAAPEPAPAASTAPPAEATEPEMPAPKKSRFALPKLLGKKEQPGPAPEAAPAPELAEPSAPEAPPEPAARAEPPPAASFAPPPEPFTPSYDLSVWRQEEDAWVRVVRETPVPIVRRVLDEEGNVVREEPATQRDLDEATGVRAERGLGRLLRRK